MIKHVLIATVALGALVGCSQPDTRLSGLREDIRSDQKAAINQTRDVALPKTVSNASWTHRNGAASHAGPMGALAPDLTLAFATDIGEGNSRRARITASPVVDNGLIYTLDARSRVTATNMAGQPVWTADVLPPRDGANDASGGGLATVDGKVFVSSGFGVLTALDARNGAVIWEQDLDAPGTAAPTVRHGLVYVTAKNSSAWALDVDTGRIVWRVDGTPAVASFSGGAGAAVGDTLAIVPFPSGQVIATFAKGGLRRWSTVISGERLGRAAGVIDDIAGDPVIFGDRVYVGNLGGQTSALSMTNGDRIWTAADGALGPVWPVKDAVFLVNDLNQLVRLNASDGETVWRVTLPRQTEGGFTQKPAMIGHYGPILAGGRIIVASSDGLLRQFDPKSGIMVATTPIPAGAASAPAIANGTLFVVTTDGQLLGFR